LNGGNVVRAGRQLRRHRNTIARALEEFGITDLPRQIRRRRIRQARLPLTADNVISFNKPTDRSIA
jgi:hypothetical protein